MININEWQSAPVADPSQFEVLPDGRYVCRIDAVKLEPAKSVMGKDIPDCLIYEMTVVSGDKSGVRCRKQDFINNQKVMSFIKMDIVSLGLQIPANPNDLTFAMQPAIGKSIEIEVKRTTSNQGKEFVNTYIKRLCTVMQSQPAQAASAVDAYRQLQQQAKQQAQQVKQPASPFSNLPGNEEIPF